MTGAQSPTRSRCAGAMPDEPCGVLQHGHLLLSSVHLGTDDLVSAYISANGFSRAPPSAKLSSPLCAPRPRSSGNIPSSRSISSHRLCPHSTCHGHIRHLLGEDPIAHRPRPQRRPVSRPRQQRLTLPNHLLVQNLHPALQIILRFKNRSRRIVRFQRAVRLPVEVAPIPLLVL